MTNYRSFNDHQELVHPEFSFYVEILWAATKFIMRTRIYLLVVFFKGMDVEVPSMLISLKL